METVLEELPDELKPRPDNFFYKKHSDHAGFKAPVEGEKAEETADKK